MENIYLDGVTNDSDQYLTVIYSDIIMYITKLYFFHEGYTYI